MKFPRKWAVYRLVNPQNSVGINGVLDRQKFKNELYVVTEVKRRGLQFITLRRCIDGKEVMGQYTADTFFQQFEEVV